MSNLPLTKNNLKKFMNAYANKIESKAQRAPSEVSFASTKRSKSQSSNRSRSRSKGKIKRTKSVRGARAKAIKSNMIKTLSPIVKSIESQTKKLALAKSGYFMVNQDLKDVKSDIPSMQKELDTLTRELQLALGAIRAGLGDKPIRMQLSVPFVITTTVTTGVTNTVTLSGGNSALNPSLCSEWSSCAALFEEFKNLGGHIVFNYINPITNATATSLVPDNLPVMAYDADDNTSATSSALLTQAAQHRVYEASVGGTTPSITSVPACCVTHHFKWHVPKGTAAVNNGAQDQPGTQWIPVNTGTPSCGFLKFYHLGQCITANNTGSGIIYFDLEFRCRS
jgi:hypothetical protein